MLRNNRDLWIILVHPRADRKTHQQFVDDTMLMGHPYVQEAKTLKEFLINFGKASGLEANDKKIPGLFIKYP